MKNKKKITDVSVAAVVAALYVVLTLLSSALGLSNGAVQVRLSEALCIMPLFTSAGVWGLFFGCFAANLMTGCALLDVVFGSLATLLGALGTYFIGKKSKLLSTVSPVIANTVAVPLLLAFVYHAEGGLWFFFVTVFCGEVISCCVLGTLLRKSLEKMKIPFFRGN